MVTLPPNCLCSSSAPPSRDDTVRRAKLVWHAAEWRAANDAHRSDKISDRDLAGGSFGAPQEPQMALSRRGLNIPPTLLPPPTKRSNSSALCCSAFAVPRLLALDLLKLALRGPCRERWRTLSFNLNLRSPSQVDAVSGCSRLDCRFASRSGFTSAMAMAPPTIIMTPHMKKPVLNPSSGVVAVSMTLPMI